MISGLGLFLVIFFLLIASAFFSGSEIALFSLKKIRLHTLVEKKDKKALLIKKLTDEVSQLLSTILIGNTFVNIAASSIATAIAITFFGPARMETGVVIATLFMTAMILIFGEMVPKSIAAKNPQNFSYRVIKPMQGFVFLFTPLVKIVTFLSDFIIRVVFRQVEKEPVITEEDIKTAISVGEKEGVLEEKEKEMLHSVIEFTDIMVKEIMIPRQDVVALDIESTEEEIVKTVVEKGFSRIPVYQDNLDNILGIIYAKDLLKCWQLKKKIVLKELLRPAYFIPETKEIGDLLKEFQAKKIHLAIVLNEFSGMEGLVTFEDILEEIVGEIQDEYDQEEKELKIMEDGTMVVKARMEIDHFNKQTKLNLPKKEYETVGGFVIDLIDRIPSQGEKIRYQDLIFEILEMKKRRILKIKITPQRETVSN